MVPRAGKGHRAMERTRVNGAELEHELRRTGEPVLLIHGSYIGERAKTPR